MSHPVVEQALQEGRTSLREWEAYQLCAAYGIPHPEWALARDEEEAVRAARCLPNPLVLKVASPDVLHKSDVGGVLVGVQGQEAVREGFRRLREQLGARLPHARWEGVLLQPLVTGSAEVIVGGLADRQFGPVVMVGSGGILVEVLQDVAFRLAPLDHDEALRQIQETACFRLLKGLRGKPAADVHALADVVVRVGQLMASEPAIQELDLNPVIAGPQGCWVVDARVVLTRPSAGTPPQGGATGEKLPTTEG